MSFQSILHVNTFDETIEKANEVRQENFQYKVQ